MRKETINGVDFELINPNTKKAQEIDRTYDFFVTRYGLRSIWEAYGRPSARKEAIYEEWVDFFGSIGLSCCVLGANSCVFSIGAYNPETYDMYYITPSHNYLIKGGAIYD